MTNEPPEPAMLAGDGVHGRAEAGLQGLEHPHHPLSLSKLTILYLCTGGVYGIGWYRRSMRASCRSSAKVNFAGWTALFACYTLGVAWYWAITVGLPIETGVPPARWMAWTGAIILAVLGFEALMRLMHCLEELRERAGGQDLLRKPWLTAIEFTGLWLCWALPNPFRFAALLSVIPIRRIQFALNQQLDSLHSRSTEERGFSAAELALAVAGGALMLWLIGGAVVHLLETLSPTHAVEE